MIIYIEDNPHNQRLMQRMLSKYGLQAKVYASAEEGFKAILVNKPALIFVDVHLKTRVNGLDLVRWVRERGITTPIIAVTVFNMIADRKKALQMGCDDYMLKPFGLKDVEAILDKHYVESPQCVA